MDARRCGEPGRWEYRQTILGRTWLTPWQAWWDWLPGQVDSPEFKSYVGREQFTRG